MIDQKLQNEYRGIDFPGRKCSRLYNACLSMLSARRILSAFGMLGSLELIVFLVCSLAVPQLARINACAIEYTAMLNAIIILSAFRILIS